MVDVRTLGKMLWFNEEKHLGLIEADDGVRYGVRREAFVDGAPVGRCSGLAVSFIPDAEEATAVRLVPEVVPRRARKRHSGRSG